MLNTFTLQRAIFGGALSHSRNDQAEASARWLPVVPPDVPPARPLAAVLLLNCMTKRSQIIARLVETACSVVARV